TSHVDSTSAARPNLDVVHYAVELGRWIEICSDPAVSEHIRRRATLHIRRKLAQDPGAAARKRALRRWVRVCCGDPRDTHDAVERDIREFRFAGYGTTAA